MEYIAGWKLSTGEGLLLVLLFYGFPAILIITLVGVGKGVKDKYFDKSYEDIPYNPAFNLKQGQPEVKQFVPYDEAAPKHNSFGLFYIGLALFGMAIIAYIILAIANFGL